MKKADILRLMATIIYSAVGRVETSTVVAEEIYEFYNSVDPNTDQYEQGSDPEYEKTHKLAQKIVDKIKKKKEIDDLDPDDLPF